MPVETMKPNSHYEEENIAAKNNKRRQSNNKFATIMTQTNLPHSTLRRDLLLSNFDRNLTVEKAKFEPNEEPIIILQSEPNAVASPATIPHQKIENTFIPTHTNSNMNHDANEQHVALSQSPPTHSYSLRQSPSAPTLSPSTSTGTINLSSSVNNRRRLTQVRSEGNGGTNRKKQQHNGNNSNNKKQKPAMHGSASPAEVFHRNLVDAVSNVEDSDENEHYVYPFSNCSNNGDHHYNNNLLSSADIMTASNIHRPLSVRSTPSTLLNDSVKRKNKSLGEWLKQTLYNRNAASIPMLHQQQRHFDEEEEDWSGGEYYHTFQNNRKPKLRNHVKDHPLSSQQKPSLLSRWHDSFNKTMSGRTKRSFIPIQKSITGTGNRGYYVSGGGYTSDEEDAPLLLSKKQKRASRTKKNCKCAFRNWLLSASFVFIGLFILVVYRANPLIDLTVDMNRVLATDKELIFDLKAQAENWNWWTIHVADADISVFAFSQIVPTSGILVTNHVNISTGHQTRGVDPAEYLGGLTHFDEPLSIKSNVFQPGRETISQIRIKSPGADASGNERWSRIIRYPYGLVVRGVFKYWPIPLVKFGYPQSIAICNVTQVDPTSGTVSTDLDRSICSSASNQDQVDIFSRL